MNRAVTRRVPVVLVLLLFSPAEVATTTDPPPKVYENEDLPELPELPPSRVTTGVSPWTSAVSIPGRPLYAAPVGTPPSGRAWDYREGTLPYRTSCGVNLVNRINRVNPSRDPCYEDWIEGRLVPDPERPWRTIPAPDVRSPVAREDDTSMRIGPVRRSEPPRSSPARARPAPRERPSTARSRPEPRTRPVAGRERPAPRERPEPPRRPGER